MALINLLGTNTSGKSLAATAQQRVNLYYEVLQQADKSSIVAYGWPGVKPALPRLPKGVVCGAYARPDHKTLFVAGSEEMYVYDPTGLGSPSALAYPGSATLSGFGVLTWAENRNSTPNELLFSDSSGGGIYRINLTTSAITAVTLSAGGGNGVSFLANRFITAVPNTGKFAWSDLNNGNSWPALNFATAESVQDWLIHQCVLRDNLILFGSRSIEFWAPSPDLNLPFTRVYLAQNVGCAAKTTAAIGNDAVYFMGIQAGGGVKIYRISGYDVVPISTPDIDVILEEAYRANDFASLYYGLYGSYVYFGGRGFYVLSGRSENGEVLGFSLAYDEANGIWSTIKTGSESWAFNLSAPGYAPLAGGFYTSNTLVFDTRTDVVHYLRFDSLTDVLEPQMIGASLAIPQTENGTWQEKVLVCPHIFDGVSLNNLVLSRVRLDMENPQVSGNFRVGLSISRDGGKTYGSEMLRNISTTGDGNARFEWRRLGIARDYVFKFRFPDAGKIAIIGAYVETHLANK